MSVAELKQIKDLASELMQQNRSKEESIANLVSAGILKKNGEVNSPYKQIFTYKK